MYDIYDKKPIIYITFNNLYRINMFQKIFKNLFKFIIQKMLQVIRNSITTPTLSGHIIEIQGNSYKLKQKLAEGGFSAIYSTKDPKYICKVQVLSVQKVKIAYLKEKQVLEKIKHKNIVEMIGSKEQKINEQEYGFLILENCSKGTVFNMLERYVAKKSNIPQKEIIKIFEGLASALQVIHKYGLIHLDIKLQNLLINDFYQYKLCDFGSCTNQVKRIDENNRVQIQQLIEKSTTPLYRSPQQCDLYSGMEIGPKVDIFAAGCLIFMLCFHKQPFQTRLAAINKQYFIPSQTTYSNELIILIQKCFITNPKLRPSATLILQQLKKISANSATNLRENFETEFSVLQRELEQPYSKTLINNAKQTFSAIKQIQSGIESAYRQSRQAYLKMTTQTQGWISKFVQNYENSIQLQYSRLIINKCWQKNYKVEKFLGIIQQNCHNNRQKVWSTLKMLILIHNFLRKGPRIILSTIGDISIMNILTDLYKYWKQRKQRNVYSLIIRLYTLTLIIKCYFMLENEKLFNGNYSITPFLSNNSNQDSQALFSIRVLQSVLVMAEKWHILHQFIQKNKQQLKKLQLGIVLSILDEQYCLISTFVFLIVGFKKATSYVQEDIDIEATKKKIQDIQQQFKGFFMKTKGLAEKAGTGTLSKSQEEKLLNTLHFNQQVLNTIKHIKISNQKLPNYSIKQHLNHDININGFKLPLSFEQITQNPDLLIGLGSSKKQQSSFDMSDFSKPGSKIKQPEQKNQPNVAEQNIDEFFTHQSLHWVVFKDGKPHLHDNKQLVEQKAEQISELKQQKQQVPPSWPSFEQLTKKAKNAVATQPKKETETKQDKFKVMSKKQLDVLLQKKKSTKQQKTIKNVSVNIFDEIDKKIAQQPQKKDNKTDFQNWFQ